MDELLERLRALVSRYNLRDQKTHVTLVSITATLVIVLALIPLLSSDDDDTSAIPSSSSSASDDPSVSDPVTSGVGASPGATRRPGSTTVTGPGTADDGADAPPGVGVGPSEIKIGITYTEDPGGANAAAGFSVAQIDQRRGWEAMIADINRDPPMGRKVVPVWYSQTENEFTSKGADRVAQEACARFTQDTKVFMV